MLPIFLFLLNGVLTNGFSNFFTNHVLLSHHHFYDGDIYDFMGENSSAEILYGDTANGMFGASVAVWGNRMVVGAPGTHEHGKGSVFVYYRADGTAKWQLEHTFQNERGGKEDSDQFGCDVDIYENTVVVGANMADGLGDDSGAAFIYEVEYHEEPQQHAHSLAGRDVSLSEGGDANVHHEPHYEWKLVLEISPDDGAGQDYFGSAVAIYGNVTVVGCWGCDPMGTYSGAVYVYTKYYVIQENNMFKMSWGYHQKLVPENGRRYDWFGIDVGVYADIIVVGASGVDDTDSLETKVGASYIYSPVTDDSYGDGINWIPVAELMAGDGRHNDGFGSSVSVCRDIVMIGSPNADTTTRGSGAVYVFARNVFKEWYFLEKINPFEPVLNGHFGYGVSLDMGIAVIGAFNSTGMGSAHIYGLETDVVDSSLIRWELAFVFSPGNEIPGDKFAYAVDVHDSTAVVGAFGASSAWEQVFDDDGPDSHHQRELYSNGAVYSYTGNERVDIMHLMNRGEPSDAVDDNWVSTVATPSAVVLVIGGLFVALYAYYYHLTREAHNKIANGTTAHPDHRSAAPVPTCQRTGVTSFINAVPFLKNISSAVSDDSYEHAPADSEHGAAISTALDVSERTEYDNSIDYSSELDESLARIAKRQKAGDGSSAAV